MGFGTPSRCHNLVTDSSGNPQAGAVVTITLSQPGTLPGTPAFYPLVQSMLTDSGGNYWAWLYANADFQPAGTWYVVNEQSADGRINNQYDVQVPADGNRYEMSAIRYSPPAGSAAHVSSLTVDGAVTATAGPLSFPSASLPEGTVANLTSDLAAKALDSAVVHLAGAETITGAKTVNASLLIGSGTPYVDVLSKGADPAGVNASDAAFANAISALPAGGGIILVPLGVYKLTQPLNVGKHIRLVGAGRDLDNTSNPPSVISYQPTATGTTAITLTAHSSIVENLLLVQGNATGTTNGLTVSGAFSGSVRDLTAMSFTGVGISLLATATASCIEWSFDQVRSAGNGTGLILQGNAAAGKSCNSHLFKGCQIVDNTVNNLKMAQLTSDNTFDCCDLSTVGTTMTDVIVGDGSGPAGTIRGNAFINCDVENGAVGFQLGSDSQMTTIWGNITATTKISAAAGATGIVYDTHGGSWYTIGNVGLNWDSGGHVGLAGAAPSSGAPLTFPAGTGIVAAGATIAIVNSTNLAPRALLVEAPLSGAGTPLTQVTVYTPTLTPGSVAANSLAEQTFAVAGLATSDKLIVNGPGAVGIANARVSAAGTLALTFANPTAGAVTPPSGVYTVLAMRS